MTASVAIERADAALRSARLLLDHGDNDGACNRAYYAMYEAAKACLLVVPGGMEPPLRTHSALIARFGLAVVKPGLLPLELGRAFNRVHELRLSADYNDEPVPQDLAADAVAWAERFVAAASALVSRTVTPRP